MTIINRKTSKRQFAIASDLHQIKLTSRQNEIYWKNKFHNLQTDHLYMDLKMYSCLGSYQIYIKITFTRTRTILHFFDKSQKRIKLSVDRLSLKASKRSVCEVIFRHN